MKKLLIIMVAAIMAVSFTACASDTAKSVTTSSKASSSSKAKGLEAAIAEQPALLTTVGQSADVEIVKVMMDKGELKYTMNSMATANDIGDNKTLVLAIGGSSKGLGAAGIDANQEIDRVKKLLEAAKAKGLVIIALHIGGEARRGDLSDKFIAPCFEKANYALVVSTGDKDGLMAGLAAKAGIPMDTVEAMGDIVKPLKAAFK